MPTTPEHPDEFRSYEVSWKIWLSAEGFASAAAEALRMHRERGPLSTVFRATALRTGESRLFDFLPEGEVARVVEESPAPTWPVRDPATGERAFQTPAALKAHVHAALAEADLLHWTDRDDRRFHLNVSLQLIDESDPAPAAGISGVSTGHASP